ncbi:MAG: hypothetical protein ABFC63_11215 [Thermoguttaceae bacterium]
MSDDCPEKTPMGSIPEPDEPLVAYLDGELDAESVRRIEALLATDPAMQSRLQSLERVWNVLNELDAAPVGDPFTQSTLEMVALAARDDLDHERAAAPRRRRPLVFVAVLAAAVAGFGTAAFWIPDRNRQLLDELPVLEAMDDFRQVESIDFLRLLRKENLFLAGQIAATSAPFPKLVGPSTQKQLASMSPAEKDTLRRAEERFLALDAAERQHLRRMARQLAEDPNAAELRAIMRRYCHWLRELPQYGRWELADLDPPARITRIKQRLLDEQLRENVAQLDVKDAASLRQWMNDCAVQRQTAYLEKLPELQRKKLQQMTAAERHRRLFALMWQSIERLQRVEPGKRPWWMTDGDLQNLRGRLSQEADKRLAELPTPRDQWQQIAAWIHHAMHVRNAHAASSKPRDERLVRFFEKELTDAERDRLLTLPGDEMQRQLQWLYEARIKPAGSGRGSSGRGRLETGFPTDRPSSGPPKT